MLRIGEISYLNCTPIFSMLRSRFAEAEYCFVSGTPAELNQRLRSGEIDVCPSSSIEYGRNPGSYLILPHLAIAAVGAVKSVLLFSPLPLAELNGAQIVLTGESETSVALLKVLLKCRYAFSNSFRTLTAAEQDSADFSEPMLLIGDKALQAALAARSRYVYDLGELWFEFTGLPFVFALWLIRRTAVAREPAASRLLAERLVTAKQLSLASLDEVAAVYVQNNWTNREFLINYWRTISYDLDANHLQGLQLFFRYAAECGILEHAPPLQLLP